MKYLLIENEEGNYIKGDKTFDILECNDVFGERASEFVELKNLNEAIEFFNVKEKAI